jgi:hypothetical protein
MKRIPVKMIPAAVLFCLAAGAFFSCGNAFVNNFDDEPERYKLDFESQNDGTVLFFTNRGEDMPPNLDESIWHYALGSDELDWAAGGFRVAAQKKTGARDGLFGVVFSAKKENGGLTCWFVLIDRKQHYCYGTIKGYDVTTNGPFPCADLGQGLSRNIIDINYNAGTEEYAVYFNGSPDPCTTFSADVDIEAAGRLGYLVEVVGNEDFPDNPVEVCFTQMTPEDIGLED